ncbi:MAG TPA: hypothetical protein VMU62_10045 [Acidobacteriaceae bacterium]|nr:hypothetical protein [Acidobacteriaceae bacterium]
MPFPGAVVALLAEQVAGAFDGPAAAGGAAFAGKDEDEPAAGEAAASPSTHIFR